MSEPLWTDDDMERGYDGLDLTHDHVYHVHASECCMELGKYTRAVLDAVLPAYTARLLSDLADEVQELVVTVRDADAWCMGWDAGVETAATLIRRLAAEEVES